jgi:hypothetical protein
MFTLSEVAGCELCADLAGSAIASRIIEIQGVSREEMLTNIAAIHFQNDHATRLHKLRRIEARQR